MKRMKVALGITITNENISKDNNLPLWILTIVFRLVLFLIEQIYRSFQKLRNLS